MKKTLGFPISSKKNEKRRAILPDDLADVSEIESIFIEEGYASHLGISDKAYEKVGARISSRDVVLEQDIICDPKIGDADYLESLHSGQTIFGWIHAVQNREITDSILKKGFSAIAWEDMYYKGRHIFWRNNEIAGEAAIMHSFLLHGIFPYDTKVCLIGRGNTARGALKMLSYMGADVTVYDKKTESLIKEELSQYDVIVNAVLWDVKRTDHIIYRDDLKRMKAGSLIVDISCDRNGAIESSIPTSFDNPTYVENGIVHYVVDHTPSLFYKSISQSLSKSIAIYLDQLIQDNLSEELKKAIIIKEGVIIDQRINEFQRRTDCR